MINIYRRVCVCMWQRNTCTSHTTDKSLVKCRIRLDDMELEHVYQCLLFTHTHARAGMRSYICEAFYTGLRLFFQSSVHCNSILHLDLNIFTSN